METVSNAEATCVLSNGFCGLTVTLSRGLLQDKAEQMIDKRLHLCSGSLFANAHYKWVCNPLRKTAKQIELMHCYYASKSFRKHMARNVTKCEPWHWPSGISIVVEVKSPCVLRKCFSTSKWSSTCRSTSCQPMCDRGSMITTSRGSKERCLMRTAFSESSAIHSKRFVIHSSLQSDKLPSFLCHVMNTHIDAHFGVNKVLKMLYKLCLLHPFLKKTVFRSSVIITQLCGNIYKSLILFI